MTAAIVSTILIQDLLSEVDPRLDEHPPAFSKALNLY
jgi:hypothetical protein